jgi:hypothetical protein
MPQYDRSRIRKGTFITGGPTPVVKEDPRRAGIRKGTFLISDPAPRRATSASDEAPLAVRLGEIDSQHAIAIAAIAARLEAVRAQLDVLKKARPASPGR